jgi:hypothetical protein
MSIKTYNTKINLISNRIKYGTDGGINVDAGALYVNGSNGRIGINTIFPQSNLDISGSIITNSNISSNGNIDISGYYRVNNTPINNDFYPALSNTYSQNVLDNFTPQTGFPGGNPNRTTWSPELGLFATTVAQGIGRIITSPNGVNWTKRTTGVDLSLCNNAGGNNVTCLSTAGITVGMSIDKSSGSGTIPSLTTVTQILDISTFTTNNTITGLSNTGLVADSQYFGIIWCRDLSGTGYFVSSRSTGTGQQIVTSTDGTTWIVRTTPSGVNDPHIFSYSPSLRRVICGRGGGTTNPAFIYSDDGINWSTVVNPVPENFYFESDWSPQLGLFCAVAFSGTSNKKVILSSDGINWTPIEISANVTNSYSVVRWSPELGIFCALVRNTIPNVMISSDGINWQFYSTPSNINYRNLVWSPQLRVFVAISETGTNRIAYSFDGKTWFERNVSADITSNLRGIAWSPELGIFCINGQIGSPVVVTSALSTRPITSYNVFDSSFNNINELGLWNFQSFGRMSSVTKTTDFAVQPGENWIIINNALVTTVTMPQASQWPGREIMMKSLQNSVVSASSNIVPLSSTVTGTAILSSGGQKWATLVSDGTNWIIMQSN